MCVVCSATIGWKTGPIRSNQHAYRDAWALYHNHFCPSTKLVEKRREGARQIKRYDVTKTLISGSCKATCSTSKERAALQERHAAINPFVLKRQIEAGLKEIQRLVRAGKRSGDSVALLLRPYAHTLASLRPPTVRGPKPNLTTKVA